MNIEVCANSFHSANIAQKLGAFRVELCQDLRLDGLTPSRELLEHVTQNLEIPVHVLIRPRPGDFHYTTAELKLIEQEIEFAKSFPISGIVVGHLSTTFQPDSLLLKEWRDQCANLELTFHRAFNYVSDPFSALDMLVDAGFDRILSSGQASNALQGINQLQSWQSYLDNKLEIMPGGGIHHNNAPHFLEKGFKTIHLSAKQMDTPAHVEPTIDPTILERVLSIAQSQL